MSWFIHIILCLIIVIALLIATKNQFSNQASEISLSLCLAFFGSWSICHVIKSILKFFGEKFNSNGKAVFITGCDSGFGFGSALKLNKEGLKVYAGCFFPKGQGAKDLKSLASKPELIIVIPLDVTKYESIIKAFELICQDLKATNFKLWSVVNNAGVARFGPVEWGDYDYHFQSLFDVNIMGAIRVTRIFLPLIRQSKGRILFMASLAARILAPYCCAYKISKVAMIGFAEGLRWELKKFGVKVITIEPSFANTNIITTENFSTIASRSFSNSPKEIKVAYRDHLGEMMSFLHQSHVQHSNIDEVYKKTLKAILHGIVSRDPQHSYQPATVLFRLGVFVYQFFPIQVTHFFLHLFVKIFGDPSQCDSCQIFLENCNFQNAEIQSITVK